MNREPLPRPDFLTDPARASFRAAQRVAALGEDMGQLAEVPAGEVIWREDGDSVRLTPDGWLVYVNAGKAASYGRRLHATPELVAALKR